MTNRLLIEKYFEYANADRWDDLRALFHPEAELMAVGARPRRGRDDVMTYYHHIFDQWPEHHDHPARIIGDGPHIAVEIEFTGTALDGRTIEFDAVDVFHILGGRIKRVTSWYDMDHVRRFFADGAA